MKRMEFKYDKDLFDRCLVTYLNKRTVYLWLIVMITALSFIPHMIVDRSLSYVGPAIISIAGVVMLMLALRQKFNSAVEDLPLPKDGLKAVMTVDEASIAYEVTDKGDTPIYLFDTVDLCAKYTGKNAQVLVFKNGSVVCAGAESAEDVAVIKSWPAKLSDKQKCERICFITADVILLAIAVTNVIAIFING